MNTLKMTGILNKLNERGRRVEELKHVHPTSEVQNLCVLKISQGVVFIEA